MIFLLMKIINPTVKALYSRLEACKKSHGGIR